MHAQWGCLSGQQFAALQQAEQAVLLLMCGILICDGLLLGVSLLMFPSHLKP